MAIESGGRLLPPPTKPKRKGHESPALPIDSVPTSQTPSSGAIGLGSRQEDYDGSDGESLLGPADVLQQPISAANNPDVAVRTTVYSDARIEDYLNGVRVQAAIARLDLTQSAVWRWAMSRLMEAHSPSQVVEHFIAELPEQGRVGRPRR